MLVERTLAVTEDLIEPLEAGAFRAEPGIEMEQDVARLLARLQIAFLVDMGRHVLEKWALLKSEWMMRPEVARFST